MSKYYFHNSEEDCYAEEYWIGQMKELQISEMAVFEAKRITGSDYFYCTKVNEIGEKGENCGKSCKFYEPRNKKSGICKHNSCVYECSDEKIILTIK